MAVAQMKLVNIVGPLDIFDKVVRSCVVNREFHPENAIHFMKHNKWLRPFDHANPYTELLRRAQGVSESCDIPLDFHEFSESERDPAEIMDFLGLVEGKIKALKDECEGLKRLVLEDQQVLKQLTHIKGLNIDLSDFFDLTYVKFRFGQMPRDTYDAFFSHMGDRMDFYFFPTSIERDWTYGFYLAARSSIEKVDSLFASMRFDRIRISSKASGTADEASAALRREIEEAKTRLSDAERELLDIRAACSREFLATYSYVRYMNDSFDVRRYSACTDESFFILGWVPKHELDRFTEELDKYPNVPYVVDDPGGIDEYTPPVLLKNNRLSKAFEPFVEMYGLPSYNEIDPTPLITISYTLIFGIMFGDIGQGLCLMLVGALLWRLKGMWLGRSICYFGASGTVFGFIYGSVFGFEGLPWGFKVMEGSNTQNALSWAVWLGFGFLILVMLFNIVNGFRQKNWEKAIFGNNGICGLVLYVGLMMLALPILRFSPQIVPVGTAGAMIALPIVMVFLRDPLSKLVGRRQDWKPQNIVDFLLENFFEMFEILLSYITNTISFLRVGAYIISHASMMGVVFLLAGADHATGQGGNIAVLVIGNIVVMGIEGLLVGIQVLRLQFYELFGRFYSGDGRKYSPIKIDYKTHLE